MIIHKRHTIMFIALAAALLLFSACSPSIGGTGGSSVTVLQLLQNSSTAMSKLKSAHIDLKVNGSGDAVTTNTSATPTTTTNKVTFSLTGSGDEALPNEETMQFNVTQNATNTTSNIAQIVLGDKVYIKNTKGQWYVLDKSVLKGYIGNPFSGISSPNLTTLLGLLQHTQISDKGDESLNGQTLRHITIVMDKEALKQFLSSNQQLLNILGQQNLNTIIDKTKSFSSSVDLWIDETTSYVHRTELKFNLSVDTSSLNQLITPTTTVVVPSNVTTSFDSVVDLSKFNGPVSITAPTGAIPTDNPSTIFG
jgi:hypothetical protein